MSYTKNPKKCIASVVIIAIIFQGSSFLCAQQNDEIVSQFDKAVDAYISGQDDSSKMRLERVISNIQAKRLEVEKKDILGKCYLLMGAISEKKGETLLADENYCRAKKEYDVESIAGVDLKNLPLYRQVVKGEIDIDTPFLKAVEEYNSAQYDSSKARLEQVIGTIKEEALDKKEILGKCYLLLGAIYEKKVETPLAEENYRRAKEEFGVESIEGAVLENLIIYRKIIKGEKMIEGEGEKPESKKKKFPVLLVIGGVVVAAAVILLTKKKKTSPTPPTPAFVTSTDSLNIPEGGTADFNVRLSAQPSANVSVTVARVSGDTDINVQTGSSLTFTTSNWNQNQTVTLAANDDVDTSNDSAVIRISAAGIQNKDITATESDKGCIISVSITSPTNNESVSGIVSIQATVTSNCAVDRVEFYIDSVLKATDISEPYSYDWDTTTAFVGPHSLRVVAYSTTGNNSSQITVTVAR